jgi:hypothetical protein
MKPSRSKPCDVRRGKGRSGRCVRRHIPPVDPSASVTVTARRVRKCFTRSDMWRTTCKTIRRTPEDNPGVGPKELIGTLPEGPSPCSLAIA